MGKLLDLRHLFTRWKSLHIVEGQPGHNYTHSQFQVTGSTICAELNSSFSPSAHLPLWFWEETVVRLYSGVWGAGLCIIINKGCMGEETTSDPEMLEKPLMLCFYINSAWQIILIWAGNGNLASLTFSKPPQKIWAAVCVCLFLFKGENKVHTSSKSCFDSVFSSIWSIVKWKRKMIYITMETPIESAKIFRTEKPKCQIQKKQQLQLWSQLSNLIDGS